MTPEERIYRAYLRELREQRDFSERAHRRQMRGNILTSLFQSLPGNRPLQVVSAAALLRVGSAAGAAIKGDRAWYEKIGQEVRDAGFDAGLVAYLVNSDGGVSTTYDVPDVEAPRGGDPALAGGAVPFGFPPVVAAPRPPPRTGRPPPTPKGPPALPPRQPEPPIRQPVPIYEPVADPVADPVGQPQGDPVGQPQGDPIGQPQGEPQSEPQGAPRTLPPAVAPQPPLTLPVMTGPRGATRARIPVEVDDAAKSLPPENRAPRPRTHPRPIPRSAVLNKPPPAPRVVPPPRGPRVPGVIDALGLNPLFQWAARQVPRGRRPGDMQ